MVLDDRRMKVREIAKTSGSSSSSSSSSSSRLVVVVNNFLKNQLTEARGGAIG